MQFPESPYYGQEIKDNDSSGRTWRYDGEKWVLIGAVLTDVDFESQDPIIHSEKQVDLGERNVVTYGFDMSNLPRINPN